jgi:hypothetical protein
MIIHGQGQIKEDGVPQNNQEIISGLLKSPKNRHRNLLSARPKYMLD